MLALAYIIFFVYLCSRITTGMWVILAFVSALCLGSYDISKKIALRDHRVVEVLTYSVLVSSLLLCVPLLLSRLLPDMMGGTPFYVSRLNAQAHLLTFLKSCIVLSSWIFAYISLKHLPISVVSPMQATRPMWTLIGALLLFGERLNTWQWIGVVLAIGSVFVFSFSKSGHYSSGTDKRYYICLALAIGIGACAGLYDKFMMRRYDHNAVQVYYTFYQAMMMAVVWWVSGKRHPRPIDHEPTRRSFLPIVLISIFLILSDNTYMLALRDPDSLIAVVSTIRRGGTVVGFAYGLLLLHESDPRKKIACMAGVMAGLVCLALGSI